MHSRMPLAVSNAPDIDHVIEETRRTPFTDRIARFRLRDVRRLRFLEYDGTSDPKAHLRSFRFAITRAYLTDKENEHRTSEADLWSLTQLQNESLRSYVEKFKAIKSKIANLNEEVAIAALRNGLWFSFRFREELIVRQPVSLDDALHKALHFAKAERRGSIPYLQ
ncbi:putative retrotransposon gag domain-containing protein [Arabidopsis thaliana]